ncbi:C2H2 type zinc-finger-domain-containing protein [Cokeromyces recurvatus]|uniref:C2H2 type zinc-finger-domain-containing protein n=1 Tax=Cokeromyces recurvatus TaxID=90255 RepID=UPI00221ECD57|nr:C2H2 type zinc-finger-domain-containing protein [Cokeromyces recurvatus]KAI7901815.1 C2H2 type zinc-finger-domain-containing protein [Cokeromyces recurvatus]
MSDQEQVTPSSGLYTCLACQVAFQSAEGQRNHYRSDWHRYNLKRKVVNLPPVTLDQFKSKSEARTTTTTTEVKKPVENKNFCSACRKSFGSTNQYDNHIQSKKHKEVVAKQAAKETSKKTETASKGKTTTVKDSPLDLRITDATTEEEINAIIDEKIKSAPRLEETDCLFCTHKSDNFEDNMQHMTITHSFFIPDIEYLVDLKGLIRYLGEKITVGNVCIFCNGKGRGMRSVDAVRKHMNDKGHCKIAYDDDDDAAELVDFYDFSSSYPQLEGEDVDIDAELENITSSLTLADDELSLVLPNGSIVGHRYMKRYYDQRLKPEETRDSILINKLIGQYSESPIYESMRKSSNNPLLITDGGRHGMRPTEAFKDLRTKHEYTTKVGMNQNRLQKHFRIQII